MDPNPLHSLAMSTSKKHWEEGAHVAGFAILGAGGRCHKADTALGEVPAGVESSSGEIACHANAHHSLIKRQRLVWDSILESRGASPHMFQVKLISCRM